MHINLPFTNEMLDTLKAGDLIYVSGTMYTARDAAHKRLCEMLDRNEKLPFDLKNSVIYYVGPTPTPPNKVYGSAGPTTSIRMDAYAPRLYDLGVKATIGKGYRTQAVLDSIVKNKALYLVAIGGAGALLGKCVNKVESVAFEDLGAEALRKLYVEDMPLVVIIDSEGNNLYEDGRNAYLAQK